MDLFQNPSSLKSNRMDKSLGVAKLVLMSIGIISTLILFKVAIIPYTFDLVLSTLPQLWFSIRTWFTIPFLYIIVNFIIITIVASSSFSDPNHTTTSILETTTNPIEIENQTNEPNQEEKEVEVVEEEQEEKRVVEVKDSELFYNKFITDPIPEKCSKDFYLPDSDDKVKDFGLFFNKFITDPSPEKCCNDYNLPDSGDKGDDDSLEATWKAIMEGQEKTKKPHLKKSGTWTARIVKAEPFRNNGGFCGGDDDHVAWAERELKKSETFNDRASLKREKSMSPEELNKRAEAFIKKFNNQMKLQRMESYQRFMKSVNRRV